MPLNPQMTVRNLGGKGEVPSVVNQQRRAVLSSNWRTCVNRDTLEQVALNGNDFLICDNTAIPIGDDSVDLFITNSVPIDIMVMGSPGTLSSEIKRILASGREWIHDGTAIC